MSQIEEISGVGFIMNLVRYVQRKMENKTNETFFHPKLTRFLKEHGAYADYVFNTLDYLAKYKDFLTAESPPISYIIVYAFNWRASKKPFASSEMNYRFWYTVNEKWQKEYDKIFT